VSPKMRAPTSASRSLIALSRAAGDRCMSPRRRRQLRVTRKLLDSLDRRSPHREARAEGVTQDVHPPSLVENVCIQWFSRASASAQTSAAPARLAPRAVHGRKEVRWEDRQPSSFTRSR
jgi:hypothetical protein